jgi:hypothetical protein
MDLGKHSSQKKCCIVELYPTNVRILLIPDVESSHSIWLINADKIVGNSLVNFLVKFTTA